MTGYRLAPTAEGDLREILQYVGEQDGVDRALHVHGKFLETFELLGASPGVGRVREELSGATVRWWTVFNFVVIYEAEREPIEILRVLHGMRDLGTLL
ncbi:MAG TPA: type II toxin-antitoxin system RelE/ParE family toxin [Planctomycetota bacterium]|nr:type II toxin-antitoxin system RelE/ParE family toxin [Planctomycetota bacterium]